MNHGDIETPADTEPMIPPSMSEICINGSGKPGQINVKSETNFTHKPHDNLGLK